MIANKLSIKKKLINKKPSKHETKKQKQLKKLNKFSLKKKTS